MVRFKASDRIRQGVRKRILTQRRHRQQEHCEQEQYRGKHNYDKSTGYDREDDAEQGDIRNKRHCDQRKHDKQIYGRKDYPIDQRQCHGGADFRSRKQAVRQRRQDRFGNSITSCDDHRLVRIRSKPSFISGDQNRSTVKPPQARRSCDCKRHDKRDRSIIRQKRLELQKRRFFSGKTVV